MVLKVIHAGFEVNARLLPCLTHYQLMVVGLLEFPLADGLETISLAEIQLHSKQGHTKEE